MKPTILRYLVILVCAALVTTGSRAADAAAVNRLFSEAQRQFDRGDYPGVLKLCDSIDRITDPGDVSTRCRLLDHRSRAYQHMRDYARMFADIETLLDLPKPDSLLYRDAAIYICLADFHAHHQRFGLTQKYIDKAESSITGYARGKPSKLWFHDIWFMIHAARAQLYALNESTDRAFQELMLAGRHAFDLGRKMSLKSLEAQAYRSKGDIRMADSIYNSIEQSAALTFDHRNSAMMGHIWLLLNAGRIDDAANVITRLRAHGVHPHSLPYLDATESDVEYRRGNMARAYELLRRAVEADDSIQRAYIDAVSKDITDGFEMRQVERSLDEQRRAGKRKTMVISLLGIFAAGCGVAAWLAVRRHRKRKRAQELAEARLGNRNAELMSQTMRNEGYSQSWQVIGDILGSSADDKAKLRRIKECLQFAREQPVPRHIATGCDQPADHEFIDRLRRVHPDLTNAQTRMATMVMMNLSNKDIASAQNISVNTVKCTKNTLRRKLGITEPTEEYLKRLSAASPAELDEMARAASTFRAN